MTEDGVIDFKDRGEITHVEKGTVLAEKIPMKESRQGHNIYGNQIDTVPAKNSFIKYGAGVKISEDGFKLLASVAGFPKLSLSGRTSVHKEYITQGDVDYETGHIDYDGNVNVKGRVKSGFKVRGNDINIIELDGGIVTAEGNVRIAGGINKGEIYSKGNVYAKYIHNAKVACMGDVIITKEIVDSDIECSGGCIVENGKIMTSQISS
ncbi:MAG: FapA family protein, partial [Thermodesulfobacteriota bacterium]